MPTLFLKGVRVTGVVILAVITGLLTSIILFLATRPVFHWGSNQTSSSSHTGIFIIWFALSFAITSLITWFQAGKQHEVLQQNRQEEVAFIMLIAFIGLVISSALAELLGIAYNQAHLSATATAMDGIKRIVSVLTGYLSFLASSALTYIFAKLIQSNLNPKG